MVMLEFVETPYFITRIDALLSDEARRAMQNELLLLPEKGDLIQGTGGCRKLRVADETRGKGKRGGLRVIYFLKRDRVYFLDVYNKNEASDLSPMQKRLFKGAVKEIQ
jgi:hypothetical protein